MNRAEGMRLGWMFPNLRRVGIRLSNRFLSTFLLVGAVGFSVSDVLASDMWSLDGVTVSRPRMREAGTDSGPDPTMPVFRAFGPGDTVPPVTTLSTSPSGSGFQKTNVTVSLSASDPNPGSGVKEIRYAVNMGPEQVVSGSSASFVLSSDGVHSVAYWSVDQDGNIETSKFATVRIDKTAPEVDADLLSGVLYVSGDDSGSGLSQLRYTVDAGAAQVYTSPVTLPAVASKVTVWGVDNAGNSSTVQTLYATRYLKALVASVPSVVSGATMTVRVDLNVAAPPGGLVVALTSSAPSVLPLPATVTVAAGALSVSTSVVVGSVSLAQTVQLTAALGGITVSNGVLVSGPVPKALSLSPTVVTGGGSATGRVTLSGKAPAGGRVVTLTSGDSTVATVPGSVTVAAGQTVASFPIATSVVDSDKPVLFTAEADGNVAVAVLPVRRIQPKSLKVAPASVNGGSSSVGTLVLSAPAPAGGLWVPLVSSDPAATVPASVKVNAGATQATFPITTSGGLSTRVSAIQARLGGGVVRAPLTVLSTRLLSLTLSSTVVSGGESFDATVLLTGAAPSGGMTVSVRSGNSRVLVPTTVVVPAGATSVTFTVSTTVGTTSSTVTMLATYGLESKTASLTLLP